MQADGVRLQTAAAIVVKPEVETSEGDHSSEGRHRRRRRKRKYGRLKRIRMEGLGLPVSDVTTESEFEKQFIVVDGPRVGLFQFGTATSDADRSWLRRKLANRNRKSLPRRRGGTSASTSTSLRTSGRCERYLKQFVAALFSTVGLLSLMVGYTVLGGYVFCQLESSNEVIVKADMRQVRTIQAKE